MMHGVLQRHRACDLERHIGRVNLMVRPIHQPRLHPNQGIPGIHTTLGGLAEALLNRANVFLGDRAAHDAVLEHDIFF